MDERSVDELCQKIKKLIERADSLEQELDVWRRELVFLLALVKRLSK